MRFTPGTALSAETGIFRLEWEHLHTVSGESAGASSAHSPAFFPIAFSISAKR